MEINDVFHGNNDSLTITPASKEVRTLQFYTPACFSTRSNWVPRCIELSLAVLQTSLLQYLQTSESKKSMAPILQRHRSLTVTPASKEVRTSQFYKQARFRTRDNTWGQKLHRTRPGTLAEAITALFCGQARLWSTQHLRQKHCIELNLAHL